MTVRVGYIPSGGVEDRLRAASLAEEAGLDHLAVGDHVSFFVGAGWDGLIGSTALLSRSRHIAVNTAVYLLPLRHPVTVARQVADVADLAPGRFVFGVGIGGEDRHEVEICGVDPATRGRRMDECITIVRALLTGAPFDFSGEFFELSGAQIVPAPVESVPIVVGGRSSAAIRRAGRLGDGWIAVWVSARRYGEAVAEMHEHAAEVGRVDPPSLNGLQFWCGVGDTADEARGRVAERMQELYRIPYENFERWSPGGTPDDLAEFLAPYVDAGCRYVNVIACGESVEHEVEAVAEIGKLLGG